MPYSFLLNSWQVQDVVPADIWPFTLKRIIHFKTIFDFVIFYFLPTRKYCSLQNLSFEIILILIFRQLQPQYC